MKLLVTILTLVGICAAAVEAGIKPEGGREKRAGADPVAEVSGIENGGVYNELPPVLVEFSGLRRGADIRVEVYRGSRTTTKRGQVLADSEAIFWLGDEAILNVSGLEKACRMAGTWTLVVMKKDGLGLAPISTTTFELAKGSSQSIEGLISTK